MRGTFSIFPAYVVCSMRIVEEKLIQHNRTLPKQIQKISEIDGESEPFETGKFGCSKLS